MTPKEKAKELVDKMRFGKSGLARLHEYDAKQCALICVEMLIDLARRASDYHNMFRELPDLELTTDIERELKYLEKVKEEIENYELY